MPITKEQFLPSKGILVLPTGKKIYVSDIGNKKLSLIQKNPVQWVIFDSSGNRVGTGTTKFKTPAIINSYISGGKVYIEFDAGNRTARSIFDLVNFTGDELNVLPSVEDWQTEAQIKANEANEANGMNLESYLKIGIGLLAASILIKLIK